MANLPARTGERACRSAPVRERLPSYVELAHGRDHADVPPLKGVIVADALESVMDVAVDMVRVDRG